jgi:hypothetical protein
MRGMGFPCLGNESAVFNIGGSGVSSLRAEIVCVLLRGPLGLVQLVQRFLEAVTEVTQCTVKVRSYVLRPWLVTHNERLCEI